MGFKYIRVQKFIRIDMVSTYVLWKAASLEKGDALYYTADVQA